MEMKEKIENASFLSCIICCVKFESRDLPDISILRILVVSSMEQQLFNLLFSNPWCVILEVARVRSKAFVKTREYRIHIFLKNLFLEVVS